MTSSSKQVLKAIAPWLKEAGFALRGNTFSRRSFDVVHLINIQSSTANTASVTVNLGVWCDRLEEEGASPSVWAAHWRSRLGHVMPAKADQWWSSSPDDIGVSAMEIESALRLHGIPSLQSLPDSSALAAIWLSGSSPGLTKVQAARYLEALDGSVA